VTTSKIKAIASAISLITLDISNLDGLNALFKIGNNP
jgi:hypothetical protein